MVPTLAKFFPHVKMHGQTSISTTTAIQRSNTLENPTIQVLCKFLRCIALPYHSIVMIIDDIQWIGSSSLELFQKLACQKHMAGFMLLATCRDDEVDDENLFGQALTNLQEKADVKLNNIHLKSLSTETMSELIVKHFPTLAQQDLKALSTVLCAHTKGNAFFTTQLLH